MPTMCTSSLSLNTRTDGASTTSRGSPFHTLRVLTVRKWYGELTNCTILIATKLNCFWPNRLVDEFFIAIHKHYFKSCPVSGRSLRDPPNTVLCPFIVVPIFVTLLVAVLVVWRSKHSESVV
ncbi:Receptor activity-modifying protein 1 [Varanus komodoensis]|nr:Receptor activity-modifying protein 1 [Varanus komodoensis]